MKKAIQILLIIVLLSVLALIIVFVFNPFELRTRLIGSILNSYLSSTIEDYTPLEKSRDITGGSSQDSPGSQEGSSDMHPLLNEQQEQTLEEYGVNVSQLPSTVSPEMEACFVEKLGQERTDEIVAGDSPTALEVIRARACLDE